MSESAPEVIGWALRLPLAAAADACSLRLMAGIEIGEAPDGLWLRGRGEDAAVRGKLTTLPTAGRFVWLANGRLRREGSLLAVETLPELAWAPIRGWARVDLPPARLPAGLPVRAGLGLVPSHAAATSNALLLDFAVWREWALEAPESRLARLVFAVADADAGLVLVRGTPLPAAPGRHLVERDGTLIPAGLACEPGVSGRVIRRACGAAEGDVVFWDEAGARVLGAELFVPATRAAVRASERALAGARVGGEVFP